MPIYEYKCGECGHHLESIQKVSDEPLTDCPSCNQPGLKRLISAAGFQLKGTGWYATDFKGNGKNKKKDTGSSGSGESSSSGSESSDGGKKAHTCGGGCSH